MADYGFAEELVSIGNGKPMTLSFFHIMEALVKDNVGRYPPYLVDPLWRSWNRGRMGDLARGFIVDYLFEDGNERIRFFLNAKVCYYPDGLMVRMFHQYMTTLIARRNPVGLNLIRRIGAKLNAFEDEGRVESRRQGKGLAYRRRGDADDAFVELPELEAIEPVLPEWQRLRYGPGSKKVDPVIGNDDLGEQLMEVFTAVSGWIFLDVLRSFLLRRFDGNMPPSEVSLDEISSFSVYCAGIEDDPAMKVRVREILERRLTERQQTIFIQHFLMGFGASEIVPSTGMKKSTVYNEIAKIKEIFHMSFQRPTVYPASRISRAPGD